jgi:hypothetical protein
MAPDRPMSKDEADAVLVDLVAGHARIATSMYAVDAHPAHQYLRDTVVTGSTLALWRRTRPQIDALWPSFVALGDALEQAKAARANRPRPDLAELTRLLRGASIELNGEWITATALSDRLELACRDVLSTLAGVAGSVSAVGAGLAAVESALVGARADAAALGAPPGHPLLSVLTAAGEDLAGLRELALADPLGVGPDTGPLRGVADRVAAVGGELAELARVRTTYAGRLVDLRRGLEEVDTAEAAARTAYETAEAKIHKPRLPAGEPVAAALRDHVDELERLGQSGRWMPVRELLAELESAVSGALDAARERERFATGLLARRDELRGRLEGYHMRAHRMGRAEDPALSDLYDAAHDLLWTAPCDLAAATRAVLRYQQSVLGGDES